MPDDNRSGSVHVKLMRGRKPSTAELRRDQQRQARNGAPTLRVLLPDASQVCVELAFDGGNRLTDSPRRYTVFPPAQAHFVYDCAFGDCDGTYDLNEEVFTMLRAGTSLVTGMRCCAGHRERHHGVGPRCGLQLTYTATVCYQAQPPAAASRAALA